MKRILTLRMLQASDEILACGSSAVGPLTTEGVPFQSRSDAIERAVRLAQVLRYAQVGTWEMRLAEGISWPDAEACTLLGIDPSALPITSCVLSGWQHEDDLHAGQVFLNMPFCKIPEGNAADAWPFCLRLRHQKTQAWRWLEGHVVVVERNAGGSLVRILAVFRDITQHKQAEKRLEQEKKSLQIRLAQSQQVEALGTLAGGIAHDFNNILSAITGYAEMALSQVTQNDELHEDLACILEAGQRATSLVQQILSFSRATQGKRRPLYARPVVREALRLLQATLPTTIEIRERFSTDGPILGDSTEIHQIIMNLCTNAGLAMTPAGGILEVALEETEVDTPLAARLTHLRPGRFVRLSVRDTGCGIAPDILGRIFDPFFTSRPDGRGTGLGLSVVQGIARSYGGEVTVTSEVGKGSTFQVLLPLIELSEEPADSSIANSLPLST